MIVRYTCCVRCVTVVTYDSLFHKKNVAVAVAAVAAVAAAVVNDAKNENADCCAFDAFLLPPLQTN